MNLFDVLLLFIIVYYCFKKDKDGKIFRYYPKGLKWSDGSVEYDLPMARLSELFNVNYFIVSQINPHNRVVAGVYLGVSW